MTRIINVGDDATLVPSISLALSDPDAAEIVIEPGVYIEHLVVEPRRAPLRIRSATGNPSDVLITFGLNQGDRDATGMEFVQSCATMTIDSDDVTLENVTVENSFDKLLHPQLPNVQALALRTRGDRFTAIGCRFVGQQDTVLLDAPTYASVRRVHLRDCEIQGDVDFIYGRATALIEGGIIRSVGPGYIAAPSTARENPRGFLFFGVDIIADLPNGSVKLGRPWHPGGKPDAVGQAIFANCRLGGHIAEEAWSEMAGFAWQDARFAEYRNHGSGASSGPDRPQLSTQPNPVEWLTGWSGFIRPNEPQIVIASDSTASEYTPDRSPRTGWGQRLESHIGIPVRNLAISGASTRSFIELGALDVALDILRPGDLFLVGFGHNDAKKDERFSDVFSQYESNLRRYIVGARACGAQPILLTPIERRFFETDTARSTHGGYPQRVRALASDEGIPVIDLTIATRALWQAQGREASKKSFLWLEPGAWPGFPNGEADNTHLSLLGADHVAAIVAAELRSLGLA